MRNTVESSSEAGRSPVEQFEAMHEVIKSQRERPTGGDEVFRKFAIVTHELIEDESIKTAEGKTVAETFIGALAVRGTTTPTHAWALGQRAYQERFIKKREEFRYPYSFQNEQVSYSMIKALFENKHDLSVLCTNLNERDVGSNVVQRGAGLKLALQFYGDRFADKPRVLDIGCSQDLILKKLALGPEKQPFDDIEVISPYTDKDIDETDRRRVHKKVTRMINKLMAQHISLGECVGADIVSSVDEDVKDWVKSCSFYPLELLDEKRVQEYEELEAAEDIPGVTFKQADFLANGLISLDREKIDEPFDVGFISTVMYQLTESERERMFQVAKRHVADDGIIIVQDFAKRGSYEEYDPSLKSHYRNVGVLDFHGDMARPYGYQTLVYDMANEKDGWKNIGRWQNGRCRRFMPSSPMQKPINEAYKNIE